MEFLTLVSYFMLINGSPSPIFKAKKGLRLEDPLSHYLFILAVEHLYILVKCLKGEILFKIHPMCAKQELIQLGFIDKMLFFFKGGVQFVSRLFTDLPPSLRPLDWWQIL